MGKGIHTLGAVFGVVALAAVASPWPARAGASGVPVIEIEGRGWGHGVGLAQDGALQMGRQGASLAQILGQFYPGTHFGRATGDVRVAVLTTGPEATVTFPQGGQVTDALSGHPSAGFPIRVPAGGAVTITWNGSAYTAGTAVAAGAVAATTPATLLPPLLPTTTTTRPATTTTGAPATTGPPVTGGHSPPGGDGPTSTTSPAPAAPTPAPTSANPLWAVPSGGGAVGVPSRGRSYRGLMEAVAGSGGLRLVNQLDVETYLTGMGEVLDPGWPLASLEAQEVAARTYAMRAMAAGGELCDDTRCQVYLGTAGEYPLAEQAVAATAGMVLFDGPSLADAVYSANAAGVEASPEEGFGASGADYPYLRPAPYPTGDPMPWKIEIATADVAARLGVTGPIDDLAVASRGPSGRALTVRVRSGQQTVLVPGIDFAAALGLRSTMIDAIRDATAATAPAPPPVTAGGVQVLPDQAGRVTAAAPPTTLPPSPAAAALGPVRRSGGGASVPLPLIATAAALVVVTGAAAYRIKRLQPEA